MSARDFFGAGGDSGSSTSDSFYQSANTLISTQIADVLYLVGAGPYYGWATGNALRDTYLNGTPIQNADGSLNFTDASVEAVWGERDQVVSGGFDNPTSEVGLNLLVVVVVVLQ